MEAEPNPPPPAGPRESLEDLVYRPSLAEGNRAVQGAGARATAPVALALYALLAAGVVLAARHPAPVRGVIQPVDLVLQEGPDPAPRAPGPAAPAPAVRQAPAPVPPAPAPAPPPPRPQPAPPTDPDTVPASAPKELPREDHSRDYGASGSGAGGATGPAAGPGSGGGGAGAGGGGRIPTLDLSQLRVRSRPPRPDYPLMAKRAEVQGSVVVRILVGPDGIPVSAQWVEGPPLLRAAAEKFALAYRFEPYLANGVPQPFQFALTVAFILKR